jgi:radical SAM protein with 4Fe4S-binding SPASM domain
MNLTEFKQLSKTLTFLRLWNLLKLKISYFISSLTKKNINWAYPASISIEPTTSCNLKCPECPSGLRKFTRPTGNLKLELLDKILSQLSDYIFYITFYFQGEPFVNKDFIEMIKKVKQNNIFVATSTNAHFINKDNVDDIINSGIDRLIISLDGSTEETYKIYRRGGDFNKVIESIKLLSEAKIRLKSKTPVLELQFLVLKHNEHQIEDIKKLKNDFNLDKLSLKSAQVYEFKEGNDFIPENEKHSRYKLDEDGFYRIKNKLPNKCYRMWSGAVITWDGRVVPCCFDKDATHQMGKIDEIDFKQIWKSEKYQKFRQQILSDRKQIDICRNCTEGLKA